MPRRGSTFSGRGISQGRRGGLRVPILFLILASLGNLNPGIVMHTSIIIRCDTLIPLVFTNGLLTATRLQTWPARPTVIDSVKLTRTSRRLYRDWKEVRRNGKRWKAF